MATMKIFLAENNVVGMKLTCIYATDDDDALSSRHLTVGFFEEFTNFYR